MVSSKTLKNFVKMHEYKLNARINMVNERRVGRLNSQLDEVHWGTDCLDDRHQQQATSHWQTVKSSNKAIDQAISESSRRRPQSRYFNFILTATHQ